MNTMLGPEMSRPLVQSLHCMVAIGFVLGTVTEFLYDLFNNIQNKAELVQNSKLQVNIFFFSFLIHNSEC